jgi:hypothetical protein
MYKYNTLLLLEHRYIYKHKMKLKQLILYFYCCTLHFISIYQEKPTNAFTKYFKNTH